jgi:catechol 2,3-dioxygenase-like lactoylglutathione lyase family enzyme
MIDHAGLRVADVARSKRFYEAVLGALGHRLLVEFTPEQTGGRAAVGFGSERAVFWIGNNGDRNARGLLTAHARRPTRGFPVEGVEHPCDSSSGYRVPA